ncbi:MAG: PQQ-like beta-propeller repeat protein [Rickettsiaceae bacterium H1]|nr:PQQ-like beta-propeller repeat protein [Rickettsiaceae bacterium H1]
MKHIKCLILLLPLVSCVNFPAQQDLNLHDDKSKIPLFVSGSELKVDSSPFVIYLPKLAYEKDAINKKVDNVNFSHVFSIEKGKVMSAVDVGENIFFLNESGKIFCLNNTGEKIWQKHIPEANNYSELLSNGNVLIVNTGTTRLYGINIENGNTLWKKTLKAPVHGKSAAVGEDKFAVITIDNALYLLNANDGTLHWYYQAAYPSLQRMSFSSPVYHHKGKLILPPVESDLVVLDAKTGDKIWQLEIDSTYKKSAFYNLDDSPFVLGKVIVASNNMGKIEAFDIDSGDKKWEEYVTFKGKPYIIGEIAFGLTENNKFIALNNEGKVKWITELDGGNYYDPMLINNSLWLFDKGGKGTEYDVKTGEKIDEIAIPDKISYPPFVFGGKIYFFTDNKGLVTLGENSGGL